LAIALSKVRLLNNRGGHMKQSYLVQRFHPNLRIGLVPSILQGKRLVPIHCQQSTLDSACGVHCAVMALALLGAIKDVTVLSERRKGIAARLWKAAKNSYFSGIDVAELALMLHNVGIDSPVSYRAGNHARCLAFAVAESMGGKLAIVSWQSWRGRFHHWILIVGVEGLQNGFNFTPTALLALDPGASEPRLCGYNGRLEFAETIQNKTTHNRNHIFDGYELPVRLTSHFPSDQ
jgi:hypothetical protein